MVALCLLGDLLSECGLYDDIMGLTKEISVSQNTCDLDAYFEEDHFCEIRCKISDGSTPVIATDQIQASCDFETSSLPSSPSSTVNQPNVSKREVFYLYQTWVINIVNFSCCAIITSIYSQLQRKKHRKYLSTSSWAIVVCVECIRVEIYSTSFLPSVRIMGRRNGLTAERS